MKRGLLRTLAACAAIALGGSLAAAERYTYILVLKDRVPAGEQTEPDVAGLGGEVLQRSRNRRVVRVPAETARALAAHRAVSYMQRVQTDGEVPALPQSPMIASNLVATNDSTPPTWESGDYVYDGDGNITAIGADTYAYDTASRLVNASLTDGATQSEGYAYDSFGNLVETTRSATPSTSTPASKATNRLTNVTYDSAGNVATSESGTTQYFYDGFNMLRFMDTSAPGTGIYYVYTADDERVGVDDYGEKRWMVRDLSGKVLREWEATNGPWWVWREDYVYRSGALVAAERETAEGGTRHFHIDHLGTARLITDQSKQKIAHHDYFPFGVEKTDFRQEMLDRGTHWPNAMKFTGHERDFIGGTSTNNRNQLDYMHARYYSAVWGRFLSVDPIIDMKRAPRVPQMWNRYAYVANNPVNRIDPDGRRIRILGSTAERQKAFDLILANLREEDRKYVTMDRNGVICVTGKVNAGRGLKLLENLARPDVPTVDVRLGPVFDGKFGPGPSQLRVRIDVENAAGGGMARSGVVNFNNHIEVIVNPDRPKYAPPPSEVMGHELFGHAYEYAFGDRSSEISAIGTENDLLLDQTKVPWRVVPTVPDGP